MDSFGKFFVDYGEYHSNKVSLLIHVFTIPLIIFSFMGLLGFGDYLIPYVGFSGIFAISLFIYYLRVEIFCALFTGLWLSGMFIGVSFLHTWAGTSDRKILLLCSFIGINLINWALQFIGHGFYEKRNAAIKDNFFLMFNAPFFFSAEVLRFCGWKKDQFIALDEEINNRVSLYKESLVESKN